VHGGGVIGFIISCRMVINFPIFQHPGGAVLPAAAVTAV